MSVEYPKDWAKREIGDFAKATGGSRFPPAAQGNDEGDYPFYKVSDMNLPGNERVMGVANNWITETTRKKIKARTFPVGAVIFPKIGAAVATNKKRLLTQESIIDNNVMAVVVDDPEVCAFSYLRFWFETIDLRDLSNSGALPSIPGHRVHTMPIPLPPLPEQKKIAHILSTVQRAIEAQERIIRITTELKKSLMHKLFTEGLRNEPQKQTEIGPIPESWEIIELSDLLTIAQYGMSVKGNPKGSYPILRMTNQVNGQIVGRNLQYVEINNGDFEKFKVERRDILFNRTNSLDLVGRTAIFNIEGDFVFASYLIRLRTDEKKLNPFFLNCYFNTDEIQARLKSIAIRAVSQSNISATRLKGFPVPNPGLDEQKEIVAHAKALDRKLAVHRGKLEQLQDLFRTLLHELMTAKRRVHQLNITDDNHE